MYSPLNRNKWEPYIWLLPSILLIAVFVIFPILIVFKLSFSEISKAGVIGGFVGFQNYKEAVQLPASCATATPLILEGMSPFHGSNPAKRLTIVPSP